MKALFAIAVLVFSFGARADYFFRPALTYIMEQEDVGNTTTSTTRRIIDASLGWTVAGGGWALLALYGTENRVDDAGGTSTTYDRTSIGLGGGYIQPDGAWFDFVYFLSNKWVTGSSKYEGDGMQFQVGYNFKLGPGSISPQLAYRINEYKKLNGSTMTNKVKLTSADPMISYTFFF